jgi:signal transduction histidine kinase
VETPVEAPISILVVEDDVLMAEGIADILSLEGYQVETAPNGRAALVKMQASTPDLILSDIMMPEMNGHEFCTLVRANPSWRTLPFIFLTALGQKLNHRKGLELGADDYLAKPFDPDDLLVAVRARLQRAADHRAAADAALQDLRSSILTTLNHEFRTPLTYITGYSHLLSEAGQEMPKDQFDSCLDALQNGAQRLKRLVENVLWVIQIETGELAATTKMFPEQTDAVKQVANSVIKKHASQARSRGLELENDIPDNLPSLAIGREYLVEILNHLIENAIKFSREEGGKIRLSAHSKGTEAILTIQDNGVGIRPDALPWIFDSFRQVDRHKLEQQGAGLGLAIVRGLVQTHQGQVSLESQPGEGTTIRIQLPIAEF